LDATGRTLIFHETPVEKHRVNVMTYKLLFNVVDSGTKEGNSVGGVCSYEGHQ